MKVLVIGSGGREHCLAWKLAQSPLVDTVYCAPGNGGTVSFAHNIDIAANDIQGLLRFALEEKIELTVVGPEAPLVEGIVDVFEEKGLCVFGPRQDLAMLEGSKIFAKEIMQKYGVPTAAFGVFDNSQKAKEYIRSKGVPIVVKADGLAAGKGVIVCQSIEEADSAVDMMLVDKKFGEAGEKIVIEECLEGEEASILIFTDGDTIIPLVTSQDHKRAFDNDEGPNTGGMGAYSPAPLVDKALFDRIIKEVFTPLVEGLRKDGKRYKGMLYGGLMIKDGVLSVLEFNVRFGDPETQVILPKLKSDLAELMLKTAQNKLQGVTVEWDDRFCLGVVLASGGYPGSYEKGKEIKGLEDVEGMKDVFVFHAGTQCKDTLVTSGGRVLNIVSLGATIVEAQEKVYKALGYISFDKMFYRKDIGNKALKFVGGK